MTRIFAMPLLLGLVTLAALLGALLDDGLVDDLAALALAMPMLTLAWALSRAGRRAGLNR